MILVCVKKGDKMLDISYDDNANEPSIPMAGKKWSLNKLLYFIEYF